MEAVLTAGEEMMSPLQLARSRYKLTLPKILENSSELVIEEGETTQPKQDVEELQKIFPHTFGKPFIRFVPGQASEHKPLKIGVILSGGQAPGGHNVIAGLFDGLRQMNQSTLLFGFKGGPKGLLNNDRKELTRPIIDLYRNQGGFDMIGSGRDKIETDEEFAKAERICREQQFDGLVIIGGDDSNSNAAKLAEYFLKEESKTSVIGVPKTIDGDLKNDEIETSFGFDTATKVYSELIGNLQRDCLSSKKYYHFIKLMGRSASHITLECALQTHPNMALISEEVAEKGLTLYSITTSICNMIAKRALEGKNYGVILVPEGLIEFIPEMNELITELNSLLAQQRPFNDVLATIANPLEKVIRVNEQLSPKCGDTFHSLPNIIQEQLILDRDAHGNVLVSRIETELLLTKMVEKQLQDLKEVGRYKGEFSHMRHFFGYEGRCAMPTNFDAHYSYVLGYTTAILLDRRVTGYMAAVKHLTKPVQQWVPQGVPLSMMMSLETRHGEMTSVFQKSLVDLKSAPFRVFKEQRSRWAMKDLYSSPGPIQYFGDKELTDTPNMTLTLERGGE